MLQVLVVGCGAVGGYFGGRLLQSNHCGVTFLVRTAAQAKTLQTYGLEIRSPDRGNLFLPSVKAVSDLSEETTKFDVVLITCKSFGLDSVLASLRKYPQQPQSYLVIPLLNGMQHFTKLDLEFGKQRVYGGVARISSVLVPSTKENQPITIQHLSGLHSLIFGPRTSSTPLDKCRKLELALNQNATAELTMDIELDLWEKFVTLTSLAAATCLCRSTIGEILRTEEGLNLLARLLGECTSGSPVRLREERIAIYRKLFMEDKKSTLTSSMLRDLLQGNKTEAREIVREMLWLVRAAGKPCDTLATCWVVLECYENKL
ncbi:hypothetical protein BASA81_000477 [Batrachochytrium salamandrivorans]|nr:hypothetical protein BASA81_000477 [Batrachochytrium salamandrivorans]